MRVKDWSSISSSFSICQGFASVLSPEDVHDDQPTSSEQVQYLAMKMLSEVLRVISGFVIRRIKRKAHQYLYCRRVVQDQYRSLNVSDNLGDLRMLDCTGVIELSGTEA